jgi:signal transduction histidine kinase
MAMETSILYNRIEDAHRDLREAQEQIIQGEKLAAIGEMSASIAHELKNPLVSIGGFARRLSKRLTPGTDERFYAETIARETLRMEKMLQDILSFSRKSSINYHDCDLNELVEDALVIVAGAIDGVGISVKKAIRLEEGHFRGDCQQLKQVLINLLLNAVEAMKRGGELSVSTKGLIHQGKQAVSVVIGDTGGGIPLEALSNIFNPFFTTKEEGTGLGLPIAHRIVTNHGGKIEVNNRVGVGAEFTVVLPR